MEPRDAPVREAVAQKLDSKFSRKRAILTCPGFLLTCIPVRNTLYPDMAYKANTIEELLAIMKRVQGEKSLTEFAAELDMSKQYVSNVYNRHKEPSERLLEKLGFTRQTAYVPAPAARLPEKQKEPEKRKEKEKKK